MSNDTFPENTSSLARVQMRLFGDVGASAHLTVDQQRALLELSYSEWEAWERFMRDGPLPPRPGLPDMLLRIGAALHQLTVAAEGSRVSADAAGW